ncbi:hypothetical protein B0H13DRAFT_1904303 [Mycena leptocephala]|nr:hypothetical protein B0H13DRAFT_1904303 [Mycena leptocephala]
MDDPGLITDGDRRGKASGEPSRGLKRKRASPPKNSAENPFLISSSPSPICEDEELEEDRAREWVKKRALELQRGAELMLQQVSQPGSSIWLRSMMGQNIGGDVGQTKQGISGRQRTPKVTTRHRRDTPETRWDL